MDDDPKSQQFLKSPPPGAPGETYRLVIYLSPDHVSWDQGIDPPTSDDDENWMDHRLLVACEAPTIGELLSAFGRYLAETAGDGLEKTDQSIMSGEDNANWWTCTNPEALAFLRAIDDAGRRVAAFHLLEAAPYTLETTMKGCETYFRYLPAAFPDHELIAAWEAAPPHQEEGYAILVQQPAERRGAEAAKPKRKAKAKPKAKAKLRAKTKAKARPKAKGGARRSSSPRRASRRKPRRRS